MMNKHVVFICFMLCLMGCATSESEGIFTPTAVAAPPQTSIPTVATETAVSPTTIPTTPPTITPTALATATLSPNPPTVIPTRPTVTTAPHIEADLLEGLILSSPRDFEVVSIIKDHESMALAKYEAAQLTNGKWFGYATKDEKVYTVQNGQIIEMSATGQTEIPFARIPQTVFGIVNDWLLLSSFSLDWTVQQEVGNLTAVSLSTFETILISDERPYVTPIVAPDGSQVIYWENGETVSWRGPKMEVEKRPFPLFRSGAISPDGEYVAMLLSGEMHIYNLQTNQLVYQEAFANCPGDGFCFPVWHPDSHQVAYGVYIAEQVPPFALRLISLAGTVQQFEGVGFPAFSPDGEWMAVYRNVENRPETAVVHLKTGEILNTPFSGIPINWSDSQGVDS
ncbi:MAG TPA: hypothetical protein PLD25_29985 [Chloroflexota bacterium]|nr:hypothetical protein [Chloroflexota bacterium]HUM72040.1 hypothetical protein [Chloroflexota bacterium]